MGLKFYFGGSGAGKSTKVYQDLIDWSVREPERNFFIIVPDQFTMQTQKDLVCMHPSGGIMNIDVLSFGRLTHRILEEVGGEDIPVLDDTGKNLILRRVAAQKQEELQVLGSHLNKAGYIHEVKSAISEFMQYAVTPQQVGEMAAAAGTRGMLKCKLEDLQLLYHAFQNYIHEKFITSEESLDLLCRSLPKSKLIQGSVFVFDGFTGFTPVQNHVLQELMTLCRQVAVTIIIDAAENPYKPDGEQKLFYLSKKTVRDLCRLQEQAGVAKEEDVLLSSAPVKRFEQQPCFDYLERSLFRYGNAPYQGDVPEISLVKIENPQQEVRYVCRSIRRQIREHGYAYRDIAVVTGDLSRYADLLYDELTQFGIPCFIDQTTGIVLNPFIDFIRSALQVLMNQYSYASVFHFLRCGMTCLSMEEIDYLENYVRAVGIRGKKQYHTIFTRHSKETAGDGEKLERLNCSREKIAGLLDVLDQPGKTMRERVNTLYDFILAANLQGQLTEYERLFTEKNQPAKAKEYAQIYRLVMELLEQMEGLMGEDEVTRKEFYEILDAGLSEIQVGAIPQNVDRIVCGDIERTRLKEVKLLFVIGVNDGIIPQSSGNGGLISDLDREYLDSCSFELAPTPRQKMYIQRLYLYMNLTKATGQLVMTYAAIGSDGKSQRPAYLIDTMRKLYPALKVETPEGERNLLDDLESEKDAERVFTGMLREYAAGVYQEQEQHQEQLFFLYHILSRSKEQRAKVEKLMDRAFYIYHSTPLGRQIAQALYGSVLSNSVSRLERFAECEYRHFLEYGLRLQEREEFDISGREMGTLYHEVLSRFSGALTAKGLDWLSFTKEQGQQVLGEVMDAYTAQFEKSILYANASNQYLIHVAGGIMERSINTLQYQMQKGLFRPKGFEISFQTLEDIESVNFALSETERVRLSGRIDRLDTYEDHEHVYVKVMDFKSGKKDFDLVSVYYGLTLQLVLYMNAAMETEKKAHPDKEIVPAGMLYYHLDNPIVERSEEMDAEQINQSIRKELRMTGIVNADADVVSLMDSSVAEGGASDVIPVQMTNHGTLYANSKALEKELLHTVSDYVNWKIRDISKQILEGHIAKSPYEYKNQTACEYCQYREVCDFDETITGFKQRELTGGETEEVLHQMSEALEYAR